MKYDVKDSRQVPDDVPVLNDLVIPVQENVTYLSSISDRLSEALESDSMTAPAMSINPPKMAANSNPTCNCESCVERRTIEAEQQQKKRLIHARTQIHYLISCAYQRAIIFPIDAEEFKSCVDLLMSQEPDLLFRKVEMTCQNFVSDSKIRLSQQLTNHNFDTPHLAYNFVEAMFEECKGLVTCAGKVSSFFPQLEKYLSQFSHATWEKHHLNMFQSMIFNQPFINRTLAEIVNQLRQGSAQYETKHENKFTAALMRFHKFETKMHEVAVYWRDIQQLIDEYHDEKGEIRLKEKGDKTTMHQPDSTEKWEFYKIQEETARQLQSKNSKVLLDLDDQAKLSLTLRKKSFLFNSSSGQGDASNVSDNKVEGEEESDSDPPFESPLNSDGSLSEVQFPPQSAQTSDTTNMSFLCNEYLHNIHPPSVPSEDSDQSSENSNASYPVNHLHLMPTDPERDSIGSLSPQPCNHDVGDSFLQFSGPSNGIPLQSAMRSFNLSTYQHLHNLQKQLFSPSERVGTSNPDRAVSPSADAEHKLKGNNSSLFPNGLLSIDNPEPNATNPHSIADISADLPQILKDTVNRASDITPFFNDLCKDAWTSPSSSSSNNISSSGRDVPACKTRIKNLKMKKKKKAHNRSKQNTFTDSDTTDNNQQKSGGIEPATSKRDDSVETSADVVEEVEEDCEIDEGKNDFFDPSEGEDEEDADDEYDGDEETDDVCKCSKCRQLLKSYTMSARNGDYYTPEFKQHQYLLQDLGMGMDGENPICRCPSCLRLSFCTPQSNQSVGNFNASNVNEAVSQPHYYNPLQNIHPPSFMIHPHLYGFQAIGSNPNVGPAYDQPPASITSVENHISDGKKPSSPKKSDSERQEDESNRVGGLFQHPVPNSSACDWKAHAKFAPNSSASSGGTNSLHEWPTHPPWLHGQGSVPGVLPPHLLPAAGCTSAFQHYIPPGAQQYFSSLIPGAALHSGIHAPTSYSNILNPAATAAPLYFSSCSPMPGDRSRLIESYHGM